MARNTSIKMWFFKKGHPVHKNVGEKNIHKRHVGHMWSASPPFFVLFSRGCFFSVWALVLTMHAPYVRVRSYHFIRVWEQEEDQPVYLSLFLYATDVHTSSPPNGRKELRDSGGGEGVLYSNRVLAASQSSCSKEASPHHTAPTHMYASMFHIKCRIVEPKYIY